MEAVDAETIHDAIQLEGLAGSRHRVRLDLFVLSVIYLVIEVDPANMQ